MNRAYEKTATAYAQATRARGQLRVRSEARRRRELPVVTFRWPYFFGACAVSLAMWAIIIVGSYHLYHWVNK